MNPDNALTQEQAWETYDTWLEDELVEYLDEPAELQTLFRNLTRSSQSGAKDWADSYLAAFAASAWLSLVTFDRALQHKARDSISHFLIASTAARSTRWSTIPRR